MLVGIIEKDIMLITMTIMFITTRVSKTHILVEASHSLTADSAKSFAHACIQGLLIMVCMSNFAIPRSKPLTYCCLC